MRTSTELNLYIIHAQITNELFHPARCLWAASLAQFFEKPTGIVAEANHALDPYGRDALRSARNLTF
jgi:hypothetical protein